MFKQLYSSISTTFKSIPLSFIYIYHPTSFPINRYFTTTHDFITNICHPFHPRFPRRFQHICRYTYGPAALPLFALDIATLTSAADITLSPIDVSSLFISPILSLFHSNSSFNNRSQYSFHLCIIFSFSTIVIPSAPFTHPL